jgi:hypothetical protein
MTGPSRAGADAPLSGKFVAKLFTEEDVDRGGCDDFEVENAPLILIRISGDRHVGFEDEQSRRGGQVHVVLRSNGHPRCTSKI